MTAKFTHVIGVLVFVAFFDDFVEEGQLQDFAVVDELGLVDVRRVLDAVYGFTSLTEL